MGELMRDQEFKSTSPPASTQAHLARTMTSTAVSSSWWRGITCSSNGTKLTAIEYLDSLLQSSDSGWRRCSEVLVRNGQQSQCLPTPLSEPQSALLVVLPKLVASGSAFPHPRRQHRWRRQHAHPPLLPLPLLCLQLYLQRHRPLLLPLMG